ncbi:sugar transferase [Candidatus Marinimicrobia bacterium]|nr:sugar transferase [Candidatus Neomarinimicrobiota bacterium]
MLDSFFNKSVASLIIILILPILLIVIFFNFFINGLPITYVATRVGKNQKQFKIFKFRTMGNDSKKVNNKYSLFLRRTNLDELLQFFNILKGDMSIVGPRPHDLNEDMHFNENIPDYYKRYFVKPGITGWAAVNGNRGGNDLKIISERVDYDIEYIKKKSILFDIKIIFKTIKLIFIPNH